MTQAQVAGVLGIDQPKVLVLPHGRLRGFSLERLLHFLLALDQDVEIVVRPKRDDQPHLSVITSQARRVHIGHGFDSTVREKSRSYPLGPPASSRPSGVGQRGWPWPARSLRILPARCRRSQGDAAGPRLARAVDFS